MKERDRLTTTTNIQKKKGGTSSRTRMKTNMTEISFPTCEREIKRRINYSKRNATKKKREEILWGEQSISWCVAQLDIGFQCTPTSPYPLLTVFDATLLIIRPLVIYPRSNILLSAFPVSVFNHRWLRTINKHRVLWYERYQSRFNFPASIRFCNVHAQLTGVPSDFLWYDPLAHGLNRRRFNSSYTFQEGKVIEKKRSALNFILLIKDSFLRKKKQFPRASQWEVHRNEVERILTAHEVGRVMSGHTHSFGFCVSGVENVRKWDWIFSNWLYARRGSVSRRPCSV